MSLKVLRGDEKVASAVVVMNGLLSLASAVSFFRDMRRAKVDLEFLFAAAVSEE